MGTRDTCQRTLLQACVAAGGEEELARRLGVPVATVVDWLLSDRIVPVEMFLKAVDIVLADSRAQVRATRELLEQIKARHRSKR